MTRARLLVLAVGVGLVLGATPASAARNHVVVDQAVGDQAVGDQAARDHAVGDQAGERDALELMQAAARAGRDLTYSGTQRVATRRGSGTGSALAAVHHDPASGSTVDTDEPLADTAALDPRLLVLLAAAYDLEVTGPGTCSGRTARMVTAARGDGTVAGRFWLDRRTGLLLRREVFDATGERVRSSAFVAIDVRPAAGAGQASPPDALPLASTVRALPQASTVRGLPQASTVRALREDGWLVPRTLPGGYRLFDTALRTPRPGRHVLHLAYSDGLSTMSLFAQRGRLGTAPVAGFAPETVGSRPVWVRHETTERVVWGGQGRVWTLVSDAPPSTVRDAVAALPGDLGHRDGVRARLARGLGRLGGMVNPFR